MNNKIALFVSLSIFGCALTSFADDVLEVVVTGRAPSSSSSNIPSMPTGNTPVPNPTGMNQGPGYADAKAKEQAAKEKGAEIQKCISGYTNTYNTMVAGYKLIILNGSSERCRSQHPIDYLLNVLYSGQNSYTECMNMDQMTYNEQEKVAYSNYERGIQSCIK